MSRIRYVKMTTERKAPYRTETALIEQDGRILVRKRALSPEAEAHLDAFLENGRILAETYGREHVARAERRGDAIYIDYIDGRTLSDRLLDDYAAGGLSALCDGIDRYRRDILARSGIGDGFAPGPWHFHAPGRDTDIDLTFDNIIITDSGWQIIDYEWLFPQVPRAFVLCRALLEFCYRAHLGGDVKDALLAHYGIDDLAAYHAAEDAFQQGVADDVRAAYRQPVATWPERLGRMKDELRQELAREKENADREKEAIRQNADREKEAIRQDAARVRCELETTLDETRDAMQREIDRHIAQENEYQKEIAAMRATKTWRWKERTRRLLHGETDWTGFLRRQARRVEPALKEEHPAIYEHAFLPLKFRAKKQLADHALASAAPVDGRLAWDAFAAADHAGEPLVTIIVPNYNHAPYLRERLDSVYQQTYAKKEVILLDDCSTDDSRAILREYASRYPGITRCLFNEESSGGHVFRQWEKGINAAHGELIWIAESDDWCDLDFLENMVPAFQHDEVRLAFCPSRFMQDGQETWHTDQYLADIPLDWQHSFCITAHDAACAGFGRKNIIPNVSSALFRNIHAFPSSVRADLDDLRLCGDWLFYLALLRGGVLAYVRETTNCYRVHAQSTSLKVQHTGDYYREHERLACYAAAVYHVPRTLHEAHLRDLEQHYTAIGNGDDPAAVAQWFRLSAIEAAGSGHRRPAVLMAVYALTIGGGETFPIFLANELARQGCAVTLLDFHMADTNPEVRAMLSDEVPCVRLRSYGDLPNIFAHYGADIVHSHHASVDEILTHFLRRGGQAAHHVITLHGMYETVPAPYQRPLLDGVDGSCDAFAYIADKNLAPFRSAGIERYESRLRKIGNGLSLAPEGRPIPRARLGIPEDAFVLCVVSRAIPEKGWATAVRAVAIASERTERPIHLILVGSGEMYDRLRGRVPENIHLVGYQRAVRDYFATSDCGLLPSEFAGESFPLTIIDCLYCGRPMIVTDLGESANELRDAEGGLAGIVLPLTDGRLAPERLADAIRTLADDPAALAQYASRTASAAEKFHIDRVAEAYMRLYRDIL